MCDNKDIFKNKDKKHYMEFDNTLTTLNNKTTIVNNKAATFYDDDFNNTVTMLNNEAIVLCDKDNSFDHTRWESVNVITAQIASRISRNCHRQTPLPWYSNLCPRHKTRHRKPQEAITRNVNLMYSWSIKQTWHFETYNLGYELKKHVSKNHIQYFLPRGSYFGNITHFGNPRHDEIVNASRNRNPIVNNMASN